MSEKEQKIQFDFSGIKRLFSNKPGAKKPFFMQPWFVVTLLILIPLVLSISIRMIPAYMPQTHEWARNAVHDSIRSNILNEINKQYPHLPQENKDAEVEKEFNIQLSKYGSDINAQIDKTSLYFKDQMRSPQGHTYLGDIDTYFYYRYSRNIIQHGFPGDEIRNGEMWDSHMYAPLGSKMGFNIHPYVEAIWFRLMKPFGYQDIMETTFFISVVISALAIFPAFFIGRRFAGNIGGFSAAIMLAASVPFLSRTSAGVADTDPYNVVIPLFATWFFLEAFEKKDLKWKAFFGILSGLTIGFFSLVWDWWWIFDLLLGSLIVYLGYLFIRSTFFKKQKLGKDFYSTIAVGACFIIASGIVISLNFSLLDFVSQPFVLPVKMYFLKAVATENIWPNVMTTVAEQNALSINSVVRTMVGSSKGIVGGIYFILSLLGIYFTTLNFRKKLAHDIWFILGSAFYIIVLVLLFVTKSNTAFFSSPFAFIFLAMVPFLARYAYLMTTKQDHDIDIKLSFLMFAWFVVMFFASVRGVRFTLLLAPPFAIGIGCFMGEIVKVLADFFVDGLDIKSKDGQASNIIKVALSMVFLTILFFIPIQSSIATSMDEVPMMNDAWYDSLTKIKNESMPNAIINSWWDFGHWFKAIGDRAVTFDGASQNTPMAHWIGRALLTSEEKEAVGILRMLDCGSNTAFEELNKIKNDESESVAILYKIIIEEKPKAAEILKLNGLTDAQAENIIKYTHCNPPENYFITSSDMVQKSGVWSHFGSWDFNRAEMYMTVRKLGKDAGEKVLMEQFNLDKEKASAYYYEIQTQDADDWISPWDGYATMPSACTKKDDLQICPNTINRQKAPFIVNTTTMEVYIPTTQGNINPEYLIYPTEEGYGGKKFTSNLDLAIALIPSQDTYYSFLMKPSLGGSMFTKLYFYKGHGTKCFQLFTENQQFTGGSVIVWKVDWTCQQNISYAQKQ